VSRRDRPLVPAVLVGLSAGLRTLTPPAALVLRSSSPRPVRALAVAAAAGELVADKLPATPSRLEAPGLGGRLVSGAACGRAVAGPRGAAVAAAAATAAAVAGATYRTQLAGRLGRGALWAVLEDALAVGLAIAGTR
jgi:uncharacterized membrane protein